MSLAEIKSTAIGDVLVCINPANLETLAEVPTTPADKVTEAIQKSRLAFEKWSTLPFNVRATYLENVQQRILHQLDDIARRISLDNGKTITEAISSEILPVVELIDYFVKNTSSLLEKELIALGRWSMLGKQSYLCFDPIGVVGIISPWNFPFSIPMGEIIVALLVGNTVVLKPSEHTTLVGLMIAELFAAVDLPPDVFQVLPGGGPTGAAMIQKGVDKIIFTGSVATGRRIMAAAAQYLIPVVLELGGKDPMIVCPDVNIDTVSSAAVWGAFTNNGQVCSSVERLYVHESIAVPFVEQVVEKTRQLRLGLGSDPNVDLGSMTALMQLNIVEKQVQEARSLDAHILTGGQRHPDFAGYYYEPTVLTKVDHSFKVMNEETFGPLLPIMTYQNMNEAVALANDSDYGLAASIWSEDIDYAEKIARQIKAGTVAVNDSGATTFALCQTPWGGFKDSGMGRTHGKYGLLEMVHLHHIHIDQNAHQKKFWWFHYGEDTLRLLKSSISVLFDRQSGNKLPALSTMFREMIKNKRL